MNLQTIQSFEPSIEERIKNVQGTLGLDSGLQETLDTFKEIQKDPQLLFQTLRGMEHQKQDNEKTMDEAKKIKKKISVLCGHFVEVDCLTRHSGHNSHVSESLEKCLTTWYVCKLCGKALKSRWSLIEHLRTHTGEKPEVCNVCGKDFRQRSNLSNHKKRFHPV